MGVIRQPRAAVAPSSGRSTDNSEANTAQNTDTESVTSSGTVTPVHRGQNGQQSGICPVQVRRNLGTHMHSLRMKKGRRTKQRAENEKLLMSMYGIDEEDLVGAEIPHQTRSYFMDLIEMEDEELLDQFINNQEPRFFNKEKVNRRQQMKQMDQESFQPEEAFMKIGFNLRQALKKHPPMGMLEGLEEKITETFAANPQTEYVCEDLSSFERLLLHALCAYNSLNSHSFNFAGKRMIRVENPYATFFRRNPGLCEYLHSRMNLSKAHGC